MKRTISGFVLFFTFVAVCFAQQNDPNTDAKNGGNIILKAGTQISAQLVNTLDVENAKSNDDITLKLTEDIKLGDFIIAKDSELMGSVVTCKKAATDAGNSEVSIFFDFLKSGDNFLPFKASVIWIAKIDTATGNFVDHKISGLHFDPSPVFKGATIISSKGKILRLEQGVIFQLKLEKDLLKP